MPKPKSLRTCGLCGRSEPTVRFYHPRVDSRCYECVAARRRVWGREYYARNRDILLDRVHRNRQEHLEERRGYGRDQNSVYRNRLAQIKLDAGCAMCGYSEHPEALQFDHLPGEPKFFGVGTGVNHHDWETVESEIAKCQILCANCHAVITAERRRARRANP